MSTFAQILLVAALFVVTGVFLIKLKDVLIRLYITLQGPFFGATSEERINDLLAMVELKSGQKVVDLAQAMDEC